MTEHSEIQFGMTTIPFSIRRTGREKTVALRVEGSGKLVVTAPDGVPVDRLDGIVRHKATWVIQRIRRASGLPLPPSEREFVSGETVLYLGRQLRLKVDEAVDARPPRIWAGWYHVPIPLGLGGDARRSEVRRRLSASLKQHGNLYFPNRLAQVCRRLRVEKPSIVVREQKRRWGSCDRHGILRINWRIIQAPVALVDYVMLHELVHLRHPNHTHSFWATIGRAMPDYEARKARLLMLGPQLEW